MCRTSSTHLHSCSDGTVAQWELKIAGHKKRRKEEEERKEGRKDEEERSKKAHFQLALNTGRPEFSRAGVH